MLININEFKEIFDHKQANPNCKLKICNKILVKELKMDNIKKFSKENVSFMADLGIYFLYNIEIEKESWCEVNYQKCKDLFNYVFS